jgi:hypothetical protein
MKILVTGARGSLGKEIISVLNSNFFDVVPYSHSMSLSEIDWSCIDTVINCAAVIPSVNITKEDYLNGNVVFLHKLLKYCGKKNFIHFSSVSEIYSGDFYQRSKMIANSLLIINAGIFKSLRIFSLPTIDDEVLIQGIVDSANSGFNPKVDRLKYNYMSFKAVSEFVGKAINQEVDSCIASFYEKKDLYEEVVKRVDASLIKEGKVVDRVLLEEGVYQVMPDFLNSLSKES